MGRDSGFQPKDSRSSRTYATLSLSLSPQTPARQCLAAIAWNFQLRTTQANWDRRDRLVVSAANGAVVGKYFSSALKDNPLGVSVFRKESESGL
jgi:hypothetical protein